MPQLKPSSLNTALELIDGGNYVFPVRADKSPACASCFRAAVNKPVQENAKTRRNEVTFLKSLYFIDPLIAYIVSETFRNREGG
jgi:hypothetical protein